MGAALELRALALCGGAPSLVTAVLTVSLPITAPHARHALVSAGTGPLPGATAKLLRVTVLLIGPVFTVEVPVTEPCGGHALSTPPALHLPQRAPQRPGPRTAVLVGVVHTVSVPIAAQRVRDALAVLASKFQGAAFCMNASLLISLVRTVCIAITQPALGDTAGLVVTT